MFLLSKKNKLVFLILILLLVLAYITNITAIPESLILFENEELNINPIFGLRLEETITVGADLAKTEDLNEEGYINNNYQKKYNLSFLGLNLKTITTNIIPTTKVIPLGNLIGLKLYTKGVLVVGMSEIKGEDNKTYKPYEEAGIEQGDSILEINNKEINTTEELMQCISKCKGEKIDITYEKDGKVIETQITPVKTDSNTYKIGLWVRDAVAGVGTATFYDTSNNMIATLGHGIQDVDTGELLDISDGRFTTIGILNIKKGEKDNPGKIEGTINNSKDIGEIYINTEFGVYGKYYNIDDLSIKNNKEIEVASRNEIKIGKASIICTLEDGIQKEYEVEIQKIYLNNNKDNKSMVVKITDEELLKRTGGIIQGMSGSPVIQNGKLIGALTHVFVSDSTKGYALFADTMLEQITNVRS